MRFNYNEIVTGSGRNFIFSEALRAFTQNPLFGLGLGNFKYLNMTGNRTHNLFLELLVETGIIGFSLFSILIFRILFNLRRIKNEFIPFYFALVALLINGFTINMLDLRHLWLVLGLLSSTDTNKTNLHCEIEGVS